MVVENRRDKRYSLSSIEVSVNGAVGKIVDVSARGVLVSDIKGDFGLDDPCKVIFQVPLHGHITEYTVDGTVVRRIVEVMGISFPAPTSAWPAVLALLEIIETEGE
ncbi:MAG: PilZ domain-containing protein [Rhodospirillaceae bacterium]|jgi:hypothetical protein|nr:PilZ domain-containing protein [Rhodospirillales bacterium]MBT3906768.1 PilZ domain-containing protein [Rhodospirillaceae bacterium]MBT4700727.1 PilZ domain-containing protein [Rhodospirillaceae bacterium]MBT5033610.1 PilZ domain-containing protein [Rhodospirillaceae bacterium]MBT6220092.1 PilZ domain-containing protein [Rhodospirillaceae bacterium]